jgi:hypothetical protein
MARALVMWFLVWMQFAAQEFDYFQVGTYGSEEACKAEMVKARVMVTNSNSAVHCFEVSREQK